MVPERRGREDRRKRGIRMDVVMGERRSRGDVYCHRRMMDREKEGGREADGDEDAVYLKDRLLSAHINVH